MQRGNLSTKMVVMVFFPPISFFKECKIPDSMKNRGTVKIMIQPYDRIFCRLIFNDVKLFSSVQSLSRVRLFVTPRTAACQASLSITNSWSLPKPMSIESVMPSNYLILCRSLLLLPPIPPSIRVFSNESALCMRWPKYWSFSFSISPSNEHPGLISFRMIIL